MDSKSQTYLPFSSAAPTGGGGTNPVWATLAIGAGGFITSIVRDQGDGTMLARTDTGGGWYYNPTTINCGNANRTGCWQPLFPASSMPSSALVPLNGGGVYEVAIAHSNTSHWYSIYYDGCLYSTINKGTNWNKTNWTCVTSLNVNNGTKYISPYVAVDPVNEDVVLAATPSSGAFYSTDGTNFTAISTSIIAGGGSPLAGGWCSGQSNTQGCGNQFAFDTTSSVSGGKTQGIYACSYGTGCYHTTGGITGTWNPITSGGPTQVIKLYCDQNGVLWALNDNTTNGHYLYMYSSGTWTHITSDPAMQSESVAIDPSNGAHIIQLGAAGYMSSSTNTGSTWVGLSSYPATRIATDVPWLANTLENYFTPGNIVFDTSGNLWFGEGIGVFENTSPSGTGTPVWHSVSANIQQLVSAQIISPPSGSPISVYGDRAVFQSASPTVYPTNHGVNYANSIVAGHSADWSGSTAVVISDYCCQTGPLSNGGAPGISSNYGASWSLMSGVPSDYSSTYFSGSIAASTSTNWVWSLSQCGDMFYTTNGGGSWSRMTFPSGIATHDCGWNDTYYLQRQNVIADKVNAGVFYAFNDGFGAGGSGVAGIYKSVDQGNHWTKVYSGDLDGDGLDGFNFIMVPNPTKGGDFLATAGYIAPGPWPHNQSFWECTDSNPTSSSNPVVCTAFSGVKEAWAAGWGKPKTGTQSVIYFFGWVNVSSVETQGLWESDNDGSTWLNLTGGTSNVALGWPNNMLGQVSSVTGDNNTYGTVYVCTAGEGCGYETHN